MRMIRTIEAATLCLCMALTGCSSRYPESSVSSAIITTAQSTVTTPETTVKKYPDNCIVDPSVFERLDKEINIEFKDKTVIESGKIKGRRYSLTFELSDWAGNTTADKIGELSRLFWQVYPVLYERFGKYSDAPSDVVLIIENKGYEIAEAWENKIHLHDMWLWNYPEDYDCITHELAHIIQNGWNGENLEYDSYIERFADYCRFIYCVDDGRYNDHGWTLQTAKDESSRETSVRFLVWLDYNLSGSGRDFMKDYYLICTKGEYPSSEWDSAWKKLFEGTAFEGRDIDEVWKEYQTSDFAILSSYAATGETSELLAKYDARKKAKSLNG